MYKILEFIKVDQLKDNPIGAIVLIAFASSLSIVALETSKKGNVSLEGNCYRNSQKYFSRKR